MSLSRITIALSFALCLARPSVAEEIVPKGTLPETAPLQLDAPLDEVMVNGIRKFALRELAESPARRAEKWKRDYTSPGAYEQSIAANRERFKTIVGAVDPRPANPEIEYIATVSADSVIAEGPNYKVHAVRWRALDGVTAEGLLLQPNGQPVARVVVLPDADWTPEAFCGLTPGIEPKGQLPRRLAEAGCQVLVPTLINREDTFSGAPQARYTNQPHREFVYRMAFEMGRHIIGYEVQKVLAAVDAFTVLNTREGKTLPIGVAGVSEGGLLALYSAAADPRINATLVSGYFQSREGIDDEPIYRNVWSLLTEFGDAEIASLVAPRALIVETCAVPEVSGPPEPRDGRSGAAPGQIRTADPARVAEEFTRAKTHFDKLKASDHLTLVASDGGKGAAGCDEALSQLLTSLGVQPAAAFTTNASTVRGTSHGADDRQQRQFNELVDFTQTLLKRSARQRDEFWKQADRSDVPKWEKSAEHYRNYVWEEMIGKLPAPTMAPNPRSRQILDEEKYRGYEVVLDVYPDVIAGGILLLPKDLKAGERRPVVVCQHGLEGVPMDTIVTEGSGYGPYKAFSRRLAERGFVVYAPQNPYRGQTHFRQIQRMSNPLKRSLFSYILRQHERTLEWLAGLPYVDKERIGFYGLSYGGKTAVRVPPLLPGYCLSICSADYNEWVMKNVSSEDRYSYMFTGEYEMYEWNMGHVANYSELATLMTPRPFMVERGHDDGVAPDEWVAWEYSKVRRHYDKLGIGDKTEIEFFNGPHTINGQATFAFLHRHLNWPAPATEKSH